MVLIFYQNSFVCCWIPLQNKMVQREITNLYGTNYAIPQHVFGKKEASPIGAHHFFILKETQAR